MERCEIDLCGIIIFCIRGSQGAAISLRGPGNTSIQSSNKSNQRFIVYFRLPLHFLLILSIFSVVGCLSNSERVRNSQEYLAKERDILLHKETCCEDYSVISFEKLQVGERFQVELPRDGDLPRNFRTGPSYFQGVEIPVAENGSSQTLLFRTDILSERGGIGRVFVPSFKFLDLPTAGSLFTIEPELCFERFWSEIGYFSALKVEVQKPIRLLIYTDFAKLDVLQHFYNTGTTAVGLVPMTVVADHYKPRSVRSKTELWIADEGDNVLDRIEDECLVRIP